ncbi:MAG: RNA polymerase sigma factor [Acidobacteriota bacterium]
MTPQPGNGGGVLASGEAGLLRRLRAGDAAAYETLVRCHIASLLAVSRRLLGNEEDARDAVQTTFLSAFRSLPGFQGEARLTTWLHRIAINAALMKLRARKRKPEESIQDLLPRFSREGRMIDPAREWKASPERLLERKEKRQLVRDCIQKLPFSYRSVILLRDIEELDTEETARLLGVTANAVKIRLHRAHQALRTLLDPFFGGDAV